MNEYPDNELINLVCEKSEEASDVLYEKYKYIVDIVINKYHKSAYYLNVDFNELKQEALVGFSDALVSFNQERDVTLPTFITICVERRVNNYIKSAATKKNITMKNAYSLDATYGDKNETPLIEKIGNTLYEPLFKLEESENLDTLKKEIDGILSPGEKEVYELLINDFSYEDIARIVEHDIKYVYNTVQRIRVKIKTILK